MVQVGVDDYATYLEHLHAHPEEFAALFNTILINVTSYFRDAPAWEYPVEAWDRVIAVNLNGLYYTCRAVIPHMVGAKTGRIIATASMAGRTGLPTLGRERFPVWDLVSTWHHEGLPGHHLQLAQWAYVSPQLSTYQTSLGSVGANVEGWALYTERLADELGLYPDDLARFGMLGYQAWRACRLVVDTGLHQLRWSRERAIEFFYDNVGLTERETLNEVDRYIIWPGQALAYKIGQRQIEALRNEQKQRLGERFDLRTFHDALLSQAAVPLSTMPLLIESARSNG